MKTLCLILLSLGLNYGAQAQDSVQIKNTENTHNVNILKQLFLGDNKSLVFEGHSSDGNACEVSISASAFGFSFHITQFGESPTKFQFRVSRSARVSSNFQLTSTAKSLNASQISYFSDERIDIKNQQSIQIDFVTQSGLASILGIRMSDNQSSQYDITGALKEFDPMQTVSTDCIMDLAK